MTTCTPQFNLSIRCIFIECQQSILDTYNISTNDRLQISSVWYLVLRVESENYTRIEKGNRSELVSTRSGDFISPSLIKVGFTVKQVNQKWNVFQCLSFLAVSSLTTAYTDTYIPVTLLDYARPEIIDVSYTTRTGRLSVVATGGTNGNDPNTNAPLYIESYELNFEELNRRILS